MNHKSKTAKVLKDSFRKDIKQTGYTSWNIHIDRDKKQNKETERRSEIQTLIKKMVENKEGFDEILEKLKQNEEYRKYEDYFETWIMNKIIKENNEVDRILKRIATQKNITPVEIEEEVSKVDIELYKAYGKQINNRIEEMFEIRRKELERIELERIEKEDKGQAK